LTLADDKSTLPFYPLTYLHGEKHAFKFSEDYVLEHQDGQDVKILQDDNTSTTTEETKESS